MRRALVLWGPAVAWMGVIFALSATPNLGTDLGLWDHVLRKLGHAVEYGILAVLVWRATRRPAVALVAASAYAATDEFHQAFVDGRVGTVADWAIDTAGAALGLLLLSLVRRRRTRRAPVGTAVRDV
jgi:VanZ family protein